MGTAGELLGAGGQRELAPGRAVRVGRCCETQEVLRRALGMPEEIRKDGDEAVAVLAVGLRP